MNMIKIIGGLVAIGVLAYATRDWWNELIHGHTTKTVKKEHIDKLSYEYIIKHVEQVMSNDESKVSEVDNATLVVMPNKMAQDYYNFTKSQRKPFFIEESLNEDEKAKMVIVLIATSKDLKNILWGRVYVPAVLSDDFSDFFPDDKIFTKLIKKV